MDKEALKKVVYKKIKKMKITEYFKVFKKFIIIPFEDYFGDDAELYSEFVMSVSSKKTFATIIDLIAQSNNIVLSRNKLLAENFIYKYYTLKKALDTRQYTDEPLAFINAVAGNIFTTELVDEINNYVEEFYVLNMDEENKTKKNNFDPATTFYDRHYKIFYRISIMTKLIIPLTIHYIYCNPKTNTNDFILKMFMAVINIAQVDSNIDIYTKTFVYIQKQVRKTMNSDKLMWERIKPLSETPENSIEDVLNKIIINIIPKYVFWDNPITLNSVVINNSVKLYTLRGENPYSLYALSVNDTVSSGDDSIVSEAEIFDSYNTKRDESVILFRRHGIMQTINRILIRENVTLDPKEMEFYRENFSYHDFQKFALIQVFSKYFGGGENILACRKVEWVMLIVILAKIMEKTGLKRLVKFLTGKKQSYSHRRMSKLLDTSITENETYQRLLTTKYKHINGLLEKRDFIKGTISVLINNIYTYNEYQNPNNGKLIEKVPEELIEDVVNMFDKLIT